ncbi:MAG: lipoyl(octanoyl) transferase LipB [Salinisphaera sp.]|nr:lipoyl(octanoyl) transferase LipB [Salinisphaera sp.]MDN5937041.1 lipoyl(octanoyl) transferase LipB [Salinisphaera sp.]
MTGCADKPQASQTPTAIVRQQLDTPLAYEPVWKAMQWHTNLAQPGDADHIWLLQHQPVFTQGTNGRPEHLLNPGQIAVVASDRGGQATYHGPGQLMAYVLLDLRRLGLGVRGLVQALESAMIDTLASFGVVAQARREAPGVYVPAAGMAKIGAIGLRIRRGRCYHGLALNVAMDLRPFTRINPCGYRGLAVTQLADLVDPPAPSLAGVAAILLPCLERALGLPDSRAAET